MKQMLYQAKAENKNNFVNNTVGLVRVFLYINTWKKIWMTFFAVFLRFSIAAPILAASSQTCLGKWVLCYVLHQVLVFDIQMIHSLHVFENVQQSLVLRI